jgi:hypothetical protein
VGERVSVHLVGSIDLGRVPIGRTDDSYCSPLKGLKSNGELYHGVVHVGNGVEGAKRHIAVASSYAPKFGLARECGIAWARKPELVKRWLEIDTAAAQ